MNGKPRRLLSVGHSYVIGANRALAHAIQRVGGGKWEVQIVAPSNFHGKDDIRPAFFSQQLDEPCPVTPISAYLTRWVHLFNYSWPQLRHALRGPWDVVHAWEEPYILAGAEIAATAPRSARFVFRTAQSLNKRYPPPFSCFERYTLNRAAGWICSGSLVAENLLKRPRYGDRPMSCIPLGVDTSVFRPDPEAGASVRRSLEWSEPGPPVIGYLGRFVSEKGLKLLTSALDALKTPWRALFVGGGKLENELRAWAEQFPDDRVRICTNVTHDRVAPYIDAMDLLVAPSQTTPQWKEQFGRMLIEGMASGIPVIGSDSGEIPFVIGEAGVVLPEADTAAWTHGMAELLESPARRAELGRLGRERAETSYDWSVVGRKHIEFFEHVLATRADAAR